jgi:hypothetical protein
VRQGGISSPVLFTIYMDMLINRLESSKVGCYIGKEYFGVLCYADDVTLVAPTGSALQKLVDICEQFGREFDVVYNPNKSMCIAIGSKLAVMPDITLNGCSLKWFSAVKHLGNVINSDNNDQDDIRLKKSDFIAKTNGVNIHFRCASIDVRKKVFISKCCIFYGAQLWRLHSKHVNDMHTT